MASSAEKEGSEIGSKAINKNGAASESGKELTEADLDALIDAMGKMKKPEGIEEKTFEEQLEVNLYPILVLGVKFIFTYN